MNMHDFTSQKYIKNDICLACGSTNLEQILDFGRQPLANSYHDSAGELEEYPLNLNICGQCHHLQLGEIVDPDLMFRDYLYVSGTTKTLKDYFDWFSAWSIDKLSGFRERDSGRISVLDIACNDGSQLDSYKSVGCSTYGIDPAENPAGTFAVKR